MGLPVQESLITVPSGATFTIPAPSAPSVAYAFLTAGGDHQGGSDRVTPPVGWAEEGSYHKPADNKPHLVVLKRAVAAGESVGGQSFDSALDLFWSGYVVTLSNLESVTAPVFLVGWGGNTEMRIADTAPLASDAYAYVLASQHWVNIPPIAPGSHALFADVDQGGDGSSFFYRASPTSSNFIGGVWDDTLNDTNFGMIAMSFQGGTSTAGGAGTSGLLTVFPPIPIPAGYTPSIRYSTLPGSTSIDSSGRITHTSPAGAAGTLYRVGYQYANGGTVLKGTVFLEST